MRARAHHLVVDGRPVCLLQGPAGWGEWSPLPGYPCDPDAAWRAAEEAALVGWPPAIRSVVPVNALVTGPAFDPDELAGFPAVKVKVGPGDGVDLVAEVRNAVGPRVALRVDANGAWDLDTAVSAIARLARYDLELVEQPVPSLDDLARLRRRVGVPVAADECVRRLDDARRLRALAAADALVEIAGVPGIPSSLHETSVGVAAGLALAAALPALPYACGLATVAHRAEDVTTTPLLPENGALSVRAVSPDPELLARYAAPSADPQAAMR